MIVYRHYPSGYLYAKGVADSGTGTLILSETGALQLQFTSNGQNVLYVRSADSNRLWIKSASDLST